MNGAAPRHAAAAEQLDPGLEFTVGFYTGPILSARRVGGFKADYAGVIGTQAGPVFVKAMKCHGRHADELDREASVNPFLRHLTPALLWRARADDWDALGFEYLDGPQASFEPGSADLDPVIRAVNLIGQTPVPGIVQDWPEHRWDRYTERPELFAGNTLIHTGISPSRFIMKADNAAVIDWTWPGRGAAFIDPACLVIQLIMAGHTATGAEALVSACTGWREADPEAVTEFAAAMLALCQRFERIDPSPWRTAMSAAAWHWNIHRRKTNRWSHPSDAQR